MPCSVVKQDAKPSTLGKQVVNYKKKNENTHLPHGKVTQATLQFGNTAMKAGTVLDMSIQLLHPINKGRLMNKLEEVETYNEYVRSGDNFLNDLQSTYLAEHQ